MAAYTSSVTESLKCQSLAQEAKKAPFKKKPKQYLF